MPLTTEEELMDLPEALILVKRVIDGAKAIPKDPAAYATNYAKFLADVLPSLGTFVDKIRAQAAD
jgi:hypothetical protein